MNQPTTPRKHVSTVAIVPKLDRIFRPVLTVAIHYQNKCCVYIQHAGFQCSAIPEFCVVPNDTSASTGCATGRFVQRPVVDDHHLASDLQSPYSSHNSTDRSRFVVRGITIARELFSRIRKQTPCPVLPEVQVLAMA